MKLSDPETYREMAAALRDLANRSHRSDRKDRLRNLAGECELMATRIENACVGYGRMGGDAA
jgi:hypothetical protein